MMKRTHPMKGLEREAFQAEDTKFKSSEAGTSLMCIQR